MVFGGEDITADFRKILGHSVKHGGLGIPDPRFSEESAYNTSKADSGELVDSLLGGTALNYVGLRAYVCKASLAEICAKIHVEQGELDRLKELTGGQDRNRLHRATKNGTWLNAVPHCLSPRSCHRRNSKIIFASYMR